MEEIEAQKQHPSLPKNYLSLAQLQERWHKEQQRKQQERQKEEEELKLQQKNQKQIVSTSLPKNRRPIYCHLKKDEFEGENVKNKEQIDNGERKIVYNNSVCNNSRSFYRNRASGESPSENRGKMVEKEGEEIQKQIEKVEGEKIAYSNFVSNNRRSFYRNRASRESPCENGGKMVEKGGEENRKQIVDGEGMAEVNCIFVSNNGLPFDGNRNLEEAKSEIVRVQDEKNGGESKRRRNWRKNKGKSKVDENLIGGNEVEEKKENLVNVSEGNEAENKIVVVVSEGKGNLAAVRGEFRRKGYNDRRLDQTGEIQGKFGGLSINGGREGNVRFQRKYNGDYGRFGHPKRKKFRQTSVGLMWVKKGEKIDADAADGGAGNQSSG